MDGTELPADGGKPGMGGLRLDHFHGSRNPTVFRDWRASLEAVRILSNLSEEKLAVGTWTSLRGEA